MSKSAQKKNSHKKAALKRQFIILCSCCAISLVLFVSGLNLNSYLTSQKVLGLESQSRENDSIQRTKAKEYWEMFLSKNHSYFAGWIELTKIYISLGDFEAANTAFITAKEIKPNSTELRALEEKLK